MSKLIIKGIDPLRFLLGGLAIGLSFAFFRYFDQWVYFPWFPNILDSATMAMVGLVLLYDVVRKVQRQNQGWTGSLQSQQNLDQPVWLAEIDPTRG